MKKLIFLCAMSIFLAVPHRGFVFAQRTGGESICSRIAAHREKIHAELADEKGQLAERRLGEQERLLQERQKQDESYFSARDSADRAFKNQLEKLRERAGKNPARLDAIDTFETSVLRARKTYRTRITEIVIMFRKQIDDIIESRRLDLESVQEVRRKGFDDAIAQAEQACVKGVPSSSSIQATLKEQLRALRSTFQTSLQSAEQKARDNHKNAIEERKSALLFARETRRTILEQTAQEFQDAW